jgi:hypothetical protein
MLSTTYTYTRRARHTCHKKELHSRALHRTPYIRHQKSEIIHHTSYIIHHTSYIIHHTYTSRIHRIEMGEKDVMHVCFTQSLVQFVKPTAAYMPPQRKWLSNTRSTLLSLNIPVYPFVTQLPGSPASPQRAGRWSPWTPEKGR